ncbi:hypothetical protein RHGRI_035284 [Rhododendron griersonianum]|uniref:Uncharacterized protein n=1 Tax=Rhododendron griersonianum TaxID=479676 RepID=A0AAV6I6L8_9ERIC|nr:hypothetical protein RHGRI_035284 [Rhododendron griersonianum]
MNRQASTACPSPPANPPSLARNTLPWPETLSPWPETQPPATPPPPSDRAKPPPRRSRIDAAVVFLK